MKPRLVNPNETTRKERTPWGSIILVAMVTGAASAVGIKLLEFALQKGKKYNPWREGNPMLPGATGPNQFQNPYAQMAQSNGLPFQPMDAPTLRDDGPPKWFEQFREVHDAQMKAFEHKLGTFPRLAPSEDDEAA